MFEFSRHLSRFAAANLLGMVILGAMGGHKYHWVQKRKDRFNTAQLYHAVTALGLYMGRSVPKVWGRNFVLLAMLGGLTFFVAPLYYLAFKDEEQFVLKRFMPAGGVSIMLGFAAIMLL